MRDITELKRLQSTVLDLENRRRELDAENERKTSAIMNFNHDLMHHSIIRDAEPNVREVLNRLEMIHAITMAHRASSGDVSLPLIDKLDGQTDVNIAETIDFVWCDVFSERAEGALEPKLTIIPPLGGSATYRIRKYSFIAILRNLFLNVDRAIDKDTKPDRAIVTIAFEQDGSDLRVAVRDKACGIPEARLKAIWAKSKNAASADNGRGLSVVRRFLDCDGSRLNGEPRYSIDSQEGQWTEVKIWLAVRLLEERL